MNSAHHVSARPRHSLALGLFFLLLVGMVVPVADTLTATCSPAASHFANKQGGALVKQPNQLNQGGLYA
jgi:hypothetical protein